jgi:thiol-disulfide isomerase/thioredoxin
LGAETLKQIPDNQRDKLFVATDPEKLKMRKLLLLLLVAIFISQSSNSQGLKEGSKDYTPDWRTLPGDYMTWYTYTYYNIRLSRDFIGLDADSVIIDKAAFLNQLLTAKVFTFKIGTKADYDVYKLYPLSSKDESIKSVIKEMAATEIEHYKMEGKEMPAFSFTDVNGVSYSNESTKGKLVVLKCWFIACVACVKEFPELNKLVNSYKGNENVLFVSMAMDGKDELVRFLKTRKFKYAVVPGMKDFMSIDLNITQYPTHLLIDKDGKIVKVVNRVEDLLPFLERTSK